MALVEISDLVIQYDKFTAVRGISFGVNSGQVLGVLGGNGAGKSSTLKVLGGVIPLIQGNITIAGLDLSNPREADQARNKVGYCPDMGGLIPQATVREHIGLSLALHDKTQMWSYALELVERFDLTRVIDRVSSGFSHGMSRRLSIILAALASENVLILDEPFDGVDPIGVSATMDLIREAKEAGLAVLVSTHLQELLIQATDDVIVMVKGKIVDQGTSQDFQGEEGKNRYQKLLVS